jgi:hypothetical protein
VRLALVVATIAVLLVACGNDTPTRQQQVAEHGASVMPFDLDRTTHVFEPSADGGVQTVLADNAGDDEQIALIRAHLAHEAERFRHGDFGDPSEIHGSAMPGLAELEHGYERIDVAYEDVAHGAKVVYSTTDPALVDALHTWFDAQVADHGHDAEMHS